MSEEKLRLLLNKLQASRQTRKEFLDDYPVQMMTVREQIGDVPLIHGTSPQNLINIWNVKALRSREQLGKAELDHQRCFNTYGAVYASVGVMYPQRQVAIAFSPSIEEDVDMRVDASPWDTGSFYKQVASSIGLKTEEDRLTFFREHTLDAPEYREYLVDYVATCFQSAEDYLRHGDYKYPDPAGVMAVNPNNSFLRVFEVRSYPQLNLRPEKIEVVFLPSPISSRELLQVASEMRSAGINIEYYGQRRTGQRETNATSADLQSDVTDWICKRAMQRAI